MTTPAVLVKRIKRLDADMQRNREAMSVLSQRRVDAVAELAAEVGVAEAARRLGLHRVTVSRTIGGGGRKTT
jgi:ActR/RegA family two-component response regulator